MNPDTTIVTMCFDIGIERLDKVKVDQRFCYETYYLQSLDKICQNFKHVYIWCDEIAANFIQSKNHKNINIKTFKDFKQLPRYQQQKDLYLHALQSMKTTKYTLKNYMFTTNDLDAIADYLVIVNSKMDVINDAILNNFANTNQFFWVDAGIFNKRYENNLKNWNFQIATNKFKQTTFAISHFKLLKNYDFQDILYIPINKGISQIIATGFLVYKTNFEELYTKYNTFIEMLLLEKRITTEQSIFTLLYILYPDEKLFHIVPSPKGYEAFYSIFS